MVAAATGRIGRRIHATLLAVASGLISAMSAVLMKLTAEDLVDRE